MHARYPVNFSIGEWKKTLVINVATNKTPIKAILLLIAQVCSEDQREIFNDGLNWSARNRVDSIRRNTWPEMWCPLHRRGVLAQPISELSIAENLSEKRCGCDWYEMAEWVKHNALGMVRVFQDGSTSIHSLPEVTIKRSRSPGPKNQLVKKSQIVVAARYLNSLFFVRTGIVLVRYKKKNSPEVHSHNFSTK